MRTAIRTYQSGGLIDTGQLLDERYFPQPAEQGDVTAPVTSSPMAVQPAAPVPAPPPPTQQAQVDPNIPPPPFMRQQPAAPPPTAIQTQPQPVEDHDIDLTTKGEMESSAWTNQRSHRGGQKIIPKELPAADPKEHPQWADYERALELFKTFDAKTQQKRRGQLDRLYSRIEKETAAKNKGAQNEQLRIEREELKKIDENRVRTLQTPELNGQIDQALSDSASIYDKVIAGGAPEDRDKATFQRKISPLDTMPNADQKYVVRNLLALNQDLDANDAVQVLQLVASAVEPGKKGFNGLRNKAARNYKPDSVDLIGNYQINVPKYGVLRITPKFLDIVDKAATRGYDNGLKYREEMKNKRSEAAKPGWFTRNVTEPLADVTSKAIR